MEKKTLGSFLTALRKANGMTQKELADRLNVSDKAVSRWERDENYPDLALIPVIADIFGVTSDELLRGERSTGEAPRSTERSERQIRYFVENVTFRYIVGSLIAVAAVIGGFILQLFCLNNTGYAESSERVLRVFTTTIMFGVWIAACLFVGLSYWASLRKLSAMEDSEAAAAGKKKIRRFFLPEAVFLIAFFVLALGAVDNGCSGEVEAALLTFLVLLVIGALLVSPLPKRLWKHFCSYRLTTEGAKRWFVRKAMILSALFLVLWVVALYVGDATGGAFFGPGKWFFSKESFCNYMSEESTDEEYWSESAMCVRFFGDTKIYERWPSAATPELSEDEWIEYDGFAITEGGFNEGSTYRLDKDGPSFVFRNMKVDTVIVAGNPSMLPIRTFTKTGRDIGFAVWVVLWFAIPITWGLLVLRARKKASLMGDELAEKEENGDLS